MIKEGTGKQVPRQKSISGSYLSPVSPHWAFLLAQMVKNPPAMQETWFHSLGGEDSLEKEMATRSTILVWEIHEQRNLEGYCPRDRKESNRLSD